MQHQSLQSFAQVVDGNMEVPISSVVDVAQGDDPTFTTVFAYEFL